MKETEFINTDQHTGAEVTEFAGAKLNLTLDVLSKREDGYHDMVMVMQTISLGDRIVLRTSDKPGIRVATSFRYVPNDERNLGYKAAKEFLQTVGAEQQGIEIQMEKTIPVGAGMAGGSADAAAVLRGMNRLLDTRMKREELEKLAGRVGSDVAFCVAGGTSLAKGRGELLEDLPPMPGCFLVVCKPGFSISTPELFRKLDRMNVRSHPDTEGMIKAIGAGDLREMAIRMYNVFEDVDDRRIRSIAEIKGVLLDHGALGAVMTGTGSAVFGLFREEEKARSCCEALGNNYSFCRMAVPTGKQAFPE